eukprot:12932542-Prorocentrum_lima.AAC.1
MGKAKRGQGGVLQSQALLHCDVRMQAAPQSRANAAHQRQRHALSSEACILLRDMLLLSDSEAC